MSDKKQYRHEPTGKVQELSAAVAALFPSFSLVGPEAETTYTPALVATASPIEDEPDEPDDIVTDEPKVAGRRTRAGQSGRGTPATERKANQSGR